MGWFSPEMQTMKDLFLHSLQDIYYAEHQIEKALPIWSRRRPMPN